MKKINLDSRTTAIIAILLGFIILVSILIEDFNFLKNIEEHKGIDNDRFIELNEKNYVTFNPSRVVEVVENKTNTVTITSLIYNEFIIPRITIEDYNKLLKEDSLEISGYILRLSNSEDTLNNGITPITIYEDDEIVGLEDGFYIEVVDDENVKISYYGEYIVAKPSNRYLRITANKSVLKNIDTNYYSTEGSNKNQYYILTHSEELTFEDGKLTSLLFTGV